MSHSTWSFPGKVMVIDDKFPTVKEYVSDLTRNGVPVLYWNGKGRAPASAQSVRLVLLDLDLTGEAAGYDFYEDPAKMLGKIPGPFVVLIVSVNPTSDSAEKLEKVYLEVNSGRELPGFVIPEGIKKADKIGETIKARIDAFVSEKAVLGSLLTVEQTLEFGKGVSLSELAQRKFEASFKSWISALVRGTGEESVAREFAISLVRLQTRHLYRSLTYPKLKSLLVKVLGQTFEGSSAALNSRIMYLGTYYEPDRVEIQWTGDIYRTRKSDPTRKYAILITPTCDISLKEASYMTLCYGFTLTEEELNSTSHFIFKLDKKITTVTQAKNKYLKGRESVPRRFYVLDNFRVPTNSEERHVRILFDFQAIESLTQESLTAKRWRRICRLDSPYVDELLQRFGGHSVRIGTPLPLEG